VTRLAARHRSHRAHALYRGYRHAPGAHPPHRRVDPRMATISPRPTAVYHRDGTPWRNLPTPPPQHTCWAQTSHLDHDGAVWLQRCPCGAARTHAGWFHANSRATGRVLSPTILWIATRHLRAARIAAQNAATPPRTALATAHPGGAT
jgi:hypothetical protein